MALPLVIFPSMASWKMLSGNLARAMPSTARPDFIGTPSPSSWDGSVMPDSRKNLAASKPVPPPWAMLVNAP